MTYLSGTITGGWGMFRGVVRGEGDRSRLLLCEVNCVLVSLAFRVCLVRLERVLVGGVYSEVWLVPCLICIGAISSALLLLRALLLPALLLPTCLIQKGR